VTVSDLHATERIIGGLIVVGVASLLSWNHSQGGDPGTLGLVLTGVMALGGVWTLLGLAELAFGPLRTDRFGRAGTESHPAP
jgi:hypothetical protein